MERIKIQTIAAAAGALGRDNRRAAAEKAIEHDIAGVTRGLSEDIRFQSAFVCPRNGSFLTRRWREMDSNPAVPRNRRQYKRAKSDFPERESASKGKSGRIGRPIASSHGPFFEKIKDRLV